MAVVSYPSTASTTASSGARKQNVVIIMSNNPTLAAGGWGFDHRGRKKRRPHYYHGGDSCASTIASASSESSPLEVEVKAATSFSSYDTFFGTQVPRQDVAVLPTPQNWKRVFFSSSGHYSEGVRKSPPLSYPPQGPVAVSASNRHYPHQRYQYQPRHTPLIPTSSASPFGCSWKILYATFILVGLLAVYYKCQDPQDPSLYAAAFQKAVSEWDHNIYLPPFSADDDEVDLTNLHPHNLLVAQMSLDPLTDISSRPNRAYARQHVMDYVRYATGGKLWPRRACFDKIILLNMLLDKQIQTGLVFPFLHSTPFDLPPTNVEYDAVALFPPDAIVTNLDSNIFQLLLPKDKLVAIGGWNPRTNEFWSKTNVLLFNLRHKYAQQVAQAWWDQVEPSDVSCGAGNHLTMLVNAIASVLAKEEGNKDLSSVIAPLQESEQGFVLLKNNQEQPLQDGIIKSIVPSTPPESRIRMLLNSLPECEITLQTTADSVCYRYYPRCEVL